MPEAVRQAIKAVQEKRAFDLALLDLRTVASFTDYFLLCTGASTRQVQAIADAVEAQLDRIDLTPLHVEGYEFGEWVLVDYLDFVVHIFSERARAYYDLERLWRSARRLPIPKEIARTREEHR
ncbi:MAG: ribosome silencing factor [Terriglobia bacterium]